jgi:serine/threonine protein phosphatase 1
MSNYYGIDNHKIFQMNNKGRDFFVGDLHGCLKILLRALKKIEFNFETDRLFCTGDTIDRGEESSDCLRLSENGWFFSVLGNHEAMLLDAMDNLYKKEIWYRNGGQWWNEINNSERFVGIIHSGYPFNEWPLRNDEELIKSDLKNILWDREILKESQAVITPGVSLIISGHTPQQTPVLLGNHLFIDTGCGHLVNENIHNPRLTLCEIMSSTSIIFHEVDLRSYSVKNFSI